MKRIFLFIFVLAFMFPRQPLAAEGVDADIISVYKVGEDLSTSIEYKIKLTNTTTTLYAKSYKLELSGIDPESVVAIENNIKLNIETANQSGKTIIEIFFNDPAVGEYNTRNFSVFLKDKNIAKRVGDVLEISIPKLATGDFESNSIELRVPSSAGKLAYMTPSPKDSYRSDDSIVYFFEASDSSSAITAAFGEFQTFSFDIKYHLQNPLQKRGVMEIPIPPDTSFQKVTYSLLDPKPDKVRVDEDGNWIATYSLDRGEKMEVTARGNVQVFSRERPLTETPTKYLETTTKETKVWQISDPKIQSLATQLKTPREIYDYVVNFLEYDYTRVRPNAQRLGAVAALSSPRNAICMEFTDLFIAIARANGIPAREVNGYAYTENQELRPLSLVADVLHAWPEYWDESRSAWIPIDPTWGNTSGVDYFTKTDLNHIAFVMHGSSFDKPYVPGSYKYGTEPQKDVFIEYSDLPEIRESDLSIELSNQTAIPLVNTKTKIVIKNPGPSAVYNKELNILFDDETVETYKISVLLPYASIEFAKDASVGYLGKNLPNKISATLDDKEVVIDSNKNTATIAHLFMVFAFIFGSIFALFAFVKGTR